MKIFLGLLLPVLLAAEVPGFDARNTRIADTTTPFFKAMYPDWPGAMTLAQWNERKDALRRQILVAAGLYPLGPRRPAPRFEIFGKIEGQGYTIEKVLLETLPGYWVGANLYRPAQAKGRRPAILSPHGHWKRGRLEQTDVVNAPARAIGLARQGYVVLSHDMVGYGDTKQTPHNFGENSTEQLWQWGPMGLQLWNSIRAIDFLQRLPDVDPARIGATGESGGATQVMLITAVDDRVRFPVPVNMVSSIMQGGSPCENGPGLRVGTFNVEIAALAAPRPMLVISATGDWTRNVPKAEFPALQKIYALYGQQSLVENVHVDAPHNYNQRSREAMYDFYARRILGLAAGPKEEPVPAYTDEELLALSGRELPAGAKTYDQIFAEWRRVAEIRAGRLNLRDLRQRLLLTLHAEWPATVEGALDGDQIRLGRPGKGDRVPGHWFPGRGTPALIIHPGGAKNAMGSSEFKHRREAGQPVLVIDTFQSGGAKAQREQDSTYYLTFQRADAANRIQDILTALAWLEKQGGGRPELIGLERAGAVWTSIAAAAMPQPVKPQGDLRGFRGTDGEWEEICPVPGLQWAGGWKMIERLLAAAR